MGLSFLAAAIISSSVAAGLPNIIFSRTDRLLQRSILSDHCDISPQALLFNLTDILPINTYYTTSEGRKKRSNRLINVDFPAPLRPTIATFSPAAILKLS